MRLSILCFLLLVSVSGSATSSKEPIISLQRRELHEFATRASRAKNMVDLLDKSNLHRQNGFNSLREAAKNIPAPKLLTTQNGIEFVSENKNYKLEATGIFYKFLLNGREINLASPLDLMATAAMVQKTLGEQKTSSLTLFPKAEALGPLIPWAVVATAGAVSSLIAGLTFMIIPYWESSTLQCETDGSFSISGGAAGETSSNEVISYNSYNGEVRVAGKVYPRGKLYDALKKELIERKDGDVNATLEKAKATIEESIATLVKQCKEAPGLYTGLSKTPLENSVEGVTGKSIRQGSSK